MSCIFCDIAAGKSPAEIIYEGEKVFAFLDINPMNYGHTLIVPREHYPDFSTIPKVTLSEIIHTAQFISGTLIESIKAEGFNLVVNNGRAAGQTVFHFHFHIIPRFESDFRMKLQLKKYHGNLIKDYAEKIRNEIKSQRRNNE